MFETCGFSYKILNIVNGYFICKALCIKKMRMAELMLKLNIWQLECIVRKLNFG